MRDAASLGDADGPQVREHRGGLGLLVPRDLRAAEEVELLDVERDVGVVLTQRDVHLLVGGRGLLRVLDRQGVLERLVDLRVVVAAVVVADVGRRQLTAVEEQRQDRGERRVVGTPAALEDVGVVARLVDDVVVRVRQRVCLLYTSDAADE